ncbi:tRNA lysidine(34) synthetase TilS [Candidatus Peregrinibacteria bacterium]|nr:tRNA lysidine(34) synthetase TilS [Candidatus Peregrinibacteria bacterium]
MNSQEAKKLENKVFKILNKHLNKEDSLIFGASSGSDSTFLLNMLLTFQKKVPIKIVTAHVNHQLRKESDKEEIFLKNCIKKLNKNNVNIVIHTKKVDIKIISKKKKKGIEETGRKIRYEFFEKLAKKYNSKFILTAHHADDNLETILLNFTRGASLKGLSGMQFTDKFSKNIFLFRPLLDISKEEIISYLKNKNIKFFTDKSNFSQIYKRNIVRKKVIPELKKLNPSVTKTTSKNTKIIRETNNFLEEEAKKWINNNKRKGKRIKFNARAFRNINPALQKTIILQTYKNLIGNINNLENIHIEEILKILNNNIGNKRKKLGKVMFSLENNTINVAKITKKVQY